MEQLLDTAEAATSHPQQWRLSPRPWGRARGRLLPAHSRAPNHRSWPGHSAARRDSDRGRAASPGGGAGLRRCRDNQNNGPARQPLRPRPAATFPAATARRGPLGAGGGYGDLPRSPCRRHEAPRTAAEANGGPRGAGGGANAGGAARAAAPGPAASLGVQVASGTIHREGCWGGGSGAVPRGAGGGICPRPGGRGAAPCGAGVALLRPPGRLRSPGLAALPGPRDPLPGLLGLLGL